MRHLQIFQAPQGTPGLEPWRLLRRLKREYRPAWDKIWERKDGCWLWLGCDSGNGYGKIRFMGRMHMAHRLVYFLLVGDIPDGFVLDHLCRTRGCVNPFHLEPVTVQENTLRGEAKLFKKVV